jgi:hypothetical protein
MAFHDIHEGWWIPKIGRQVPRWVLGVISGVVRYNTGKETHRMCKTESFVRWLKRTKAAHQNDEFQEN